MFNTTHILYMIISSLISAGILVLLYVKVKDEGKKTVALRAMALATVAIHYSSLWIDFFTSGELAIEPSQLLPIHPFLHKLYQLY